MSVPLRRWEVRATLVTVVLSALVALFGLLRPEHYNDSAAMLPQILIEDAVVLFAGVPALALGLWAATRGSRRGRLLWLGSLAFLLYIWASKATLLRFNDAFLGYVALFTLTLFLLGGGLLRFDPDSLREALAGRLSRRLYGGYLLAAAVGLTFMWLSEVVPATLAGGRLPSDVVWGQMTNATYVLDLGVLVPAMAVAGGWLLRDRPWGYALGAVLLVFSGLLGVVLAVATTVNYVNGVPMSVPVVVFSVVPPVVGGLLGVRLLLLLDGPRESPASVTRRPTA
jgi:hypothetical protein